MKKSILILLISVAVLCASRSLNAQTIQVFVDGFSFTLTDPTFNQGYDHYDVTLLMSNADQSYWASQTYVIGTYSSPGTYTYSGGNYFYMYHESYFEVVLYASKNDAPYGSSQNRTGWSGDLLLDGNNWVHPPTIRVNTW